MTVSDSYKSRTFGDIPVGFGKRAGIVVIDFQIGYTRPEYRFGSAPLIMRALENTSKLLDVARSAGLPVAVCNTAYMSEREMPFWKIRNVRETFLHSDPSVALDPSIHDPSYDLIVCKKAPSIFYNTEVADYFIKEGVDTVIVTGCATSGCVRASTIDSFSRCWHTIVPEDCVGDFEQQPHEDNLRDVGRRYADISNLAEVIDHIRPA